MQKLSDKVTGGELLATEWVNHSKEKENAVLATGRTLTTSETQLVESIDEFSKSNFYEATATATNTYQVTSRTITTNCDIKDKMIFNVKFNAVNTGACTLDLYGDGAKDLKNADGTTLKENMINANESYHIIRLDNIYYLTRLASSKNIIKEIENLITNAGLTISSGDNNQVTQAIDIYSKSNVFDAVLSGGVYAGTRSLSVNSIDEGMVNFVRFDSANSGAVNLNLDGTSRNLYNSDGSELKTNMILAGDILPVYYDGTNYISVHKLWFKFSTNNTFEFVNNASINISNYYEWDNSLGANPNFTGFYIRGYKHEALIHANMTLVVSHDGFSTETGNNASPCKFNLSQFLKDNTNYSGEVLSRAGGTGVIFNGESGAGSFIQGTLNCAIYPKLGNAYDEKIGFNINRTQWKGENLTYKKWYIFMSFTYKVKD